MTTQQDYDSSKLFATCRGSLARCETHQQIDRVRDWAYGKIDAAYDTPGERAADNTVVLNMSSDRQRELGIGHPASHEDAGE